uniref:Contactin associated protein like 2b n=1 Tax=Dicentrarchus labrax TaxID=13489 RepID=A0A8C4D8H5_DICLA
LPSFTPSTPTTPTKLGAGGWSPLDTDRYQWLQVDLGSRKQVVAIVTQGRYSSSDWTSKYRLLYSDTQKNWRPYLQDGNIWTFDGNVNSEGVVRHELQHAILARYIRFIPVDWSKDGRIGVRLELYGCSYWADVISFDGHGVISYRLRSKKMKIVKDVIFLKFRTTTGDGVLLHGEGQQGDYISLELRRARLQLSINLGSNQYGSIQGHTSVTSGSLLDDDHWHSVVIERYRRNVNFTLDHHTQQFRTNGEFDHLDLDYEISFGGLPVSVKPSSGGRENFVGCMEGITYNGDNITNLVRRKKRNLTFSCAESNSFSVFFNSTSFLRLPGQSDSDTLSVSLSFRTWNPNGLLLFTALADGWVEVALTEGKITVYMNVTQKKNTHWSMFFLAGSGLNDGQWHSVHLNALENYAMLTVDGDEASTVRTAIPIQIQTGGTYYFGGYFLHTNTRSLQRSFQGCMQMIHVDDHLADLRALEQGLIGTFENVSLDMCAIVDRCVPNHCEHGGRCSQTWDTFSCNCTGTGYTGATCHTSMYQQSCEEYKHQGKSSGSYWIDPDSSGSLAPFRVNCDMTGEKVWTTLKNNLSPQTSVTSADQEGKAVLQITYNVTDEQVLSVTSSAEYCEQYVAYACRMSRLLNTPDGVAFTWWVGRANERHSYWGGSGPGIQKCSCGIEHNCTDPRHFCNCDADLKEDAGLLVYKDHLPVSQVVVGDTSRAGSEAKLTIGPLKCQGDRECNYWNAASFSSPASYLHFPSFRGETSTDISFYFKTSSTHGVFLENLGTTDFLHIELRGGSVVSFSFNVGGERMELSVHSPVPLNDDQWHRVEAEKNIKEAVLQLNGQYREVRPTPPQGHTKLEFYSELYVGASSGQRGFLGCMRALKINGMTFDLEGRAKGTQGVNPGCQGHCSSYAMHCRNGGKCLEKYNGYSCDCSLTAYDGPFCTDDVGGYFETGTLVRYDFLPEAGAFALREEKSLSGVGVPSEANLTQEELVFSFSTSSAPSILVYISSRTQDYLAVVLRHNGTLQIRYSLGGLAEPYTIDVDHRNMANGQPHSINITRNLREIRIQVSVSYGIVAWKEFQFCLSLVVSLVETGQIDPILIERYNTPGFVGCLSRVQLNSVAPLKAALRSGLAAPISTHGILVPSNCGASPLTISPMASASDPWHIELELFSPSTRTSLFVLFPGIISMVIFTVLCIMVFVIRHMFRHKGSYHTNEAKGAESADCADAAIIVNDPAFTETIDESKKEWFI